MVCVYVFECIYFLEAFSLKLYVSFTKEYIILCYLLVNVTQYILTWNNYICVCIYNSNNSSRESHVYAAAFIIY